MVFFLHSLKCLISKSWWWSHGKGNLILVQHCFLLSQRRTPTRNSHNLTLSSSFFPPGQGGWFTPGHLWGHCAQNSILPWGGMGSAREKNGFPLAFLQPGGNSRALSEPRVYRTETWSCSASGLPPRALCETCRKLLQGRAALRINPKPFLLIKQI